MPKAENTPGAVGTITVRDPDLARDLHGMQWSGAAIGDQRKVAGIESALGSDAFHGIGHRGRRDPQDAVCCRRRVHAERFRHALGQRALGGSDVEPHLAAEESFGPSRPSRRFASVTVGSVPPRP